MRSSEPNLAELYAAASPERQRDADNDRLLAIAGLVVGGGVAWRTDWLTGALLGLALAGLFATRSLVTRRSSLVLHGGRLVEKRRRPWPREGAAGDWDVAKGREDYFLVVELEPGCRLSSRGRHGALPARRIELQIWNRWLFEELAQGDEAFWVLGATGTFLGVHHHGAFAPARPRDTQAPA